MTIQRRLRLSLARRGRRIEALAWGGFEDAVLLSRAGLYRHAARRFARDARAAKAYPADHVRALLGAGHPAEALDAARAAQPRSSGDLAMALAFMDPDLAMARYRGGSTALKASLQAARGEKETALALAGQSASPHARLLEASLRRDEPERAARSWRTAFDVWGLSPPVAGDDAPVTVQSASAEARHRSDGDLVSVIMPSRNVETYIGAAVRSVLAQSHANLELLVVNDASTDATADAARAAADGDPRFRLIDRAERSGAYGARNAALVQARGRWVAIHDADEWSHPDRLGLQTADMDRRGLVASSGLGVRVDAKGELRARGVHPLARWAPSTLMFEREPVLARAGAFDRVLSGADAEYWWRLMLLFGPGRVAIVRKPWILGAWREDSLTGDRRSGFGATGYNLDRLRYWEAWTLWHVRNRHRPEALRLNGAERPFPIPPTLVL